MYEVLCDAEDVDGHRRHLPHRCRGPRLRDRHDGDAQDEYDAIRIVRRGHRADGKHCKRDVLTAKLS